MKDIKILLGKRIKELRKNLKISQQKLAEKINMDQRNLSNIERGISFPSKSLYDIALALNVTLPELFEFEHINMTKEYMIQEITNIINNMPEDKVTLLYNFTKIIR